MRIAEQWKELAKALGAHVCFKNNGLPLLTRLLDPIVAPFGAVVAVHRLGEQMPAYLCATARHLTGLTSDPVDSTALLRWYVSQRDLTNGKVDAYLAHFAQPAAPLLPLCAMINDPKGRPLWLCGICGLLCTPIGTPIILSMFYPLDALRPNSVGMAPDAKALVMLADLTVREREVLQLLGAQWRPEEVANALNISTYTVASHRKSLMRKLNARTLIGLAPFAALLPPHERTEQSAPLPEDLSRLRFGSDNGHT